MAQNVCPVWVGYFLANPLRKLFQDPEKILRPYVSKGMTVLDIGCAMGFFSLPLARMVGSEGKVICADIQEKMLMVLGKRADRAGVRDRIEIRVCSPHSLNLQGLTGKGDFALAFAVVHEVADPSAFFSEIHNVLKPGAKCLIVEPSAHVPEKEFRQSIVLAEQNGFRTADMPKIRFARAVLLEKNT